MAMTKPLEVAKLDLSEEEAEVRFEKLQAKLIPLWESISGFDQGEQTVVVVPSQSLEFDCQGAEMQAYEERMLFQLLLLRQPRARIMAMKQVDIKDRWYDAPAGRSRRRPDAEFQAWVHGKLGLACQCGSFTLGAENVRLYRHAGR